MNKNTFRSAFKLLITAFFACMLLVQIASAGEEKHIVILGTSDMHGNIWGYFYNKGEETSNSGMARLYTYIQKVREENDAVFLIDGGDTIQGTAMTDNIANKQPDLEHPVIAAMNYMGYDSMTVGNHEFNWGIETMNKILGQADFPVLGANILDKNGECVTGAGWTIIERDGVRLAVIGVCTPEIPRWDGDKEGVDELTFEPAYSAVERALKEIGDKADIILVSAHMGLYAQYDVARGSDAAEKILEVNPETDVLQVAHMHCTVNEEKDGVPVFGVRHFAREIARIDLTLDEDKHIKSVSTKIVDMADYEPSEEIRGIPSVKENHEKALNLVQGDGGEDGEGGVPIGSTTAKFQPENEIRDLPEGRLQDTSLVDLILKVQLMNSGADVTSASLYSDTSDLPEGDIYYRNLLDIYKYDNILYTLDVTGRELKDYMEWSAGYYNEWKPGDINVSFHDSEHPGYTYDMFGGVEYEINLSRPKGERIENVRFKGEPLKDDQVLKLAINNFRYSSVLKTEGLAAGTPYAESSNSILDMLVEYFEQNSPVAPSVDNNWRITGIDLSEDDPRRAEIIELINGGYLPVPYEESYNLADYDALMEKAAENKAKR